MSIEDIWNSMPKKWQWFVAWTSLFFLLVIWGLAAHNTPDDNPVSPIYVTNVKTVDWPSADIVVKSILVNAIKSSSWNPFAVKTVASMDNLTAWAGKNGIIVKEVTWYVPNRYTYTIDNVKAEAPGFLTNYWAINYTLPQTVYRMHLENVAPSSDYAVVTTPDNTSITFHYGRDIAMEWPIFALIISAMALTAQIFWVVVRVLRNMRKRE